MVGVKEALSVPPLKIICISWPVLPIRPRAIGQRRRRVDLFDSKGTQAQGEMPRLQAMFPP